MPWPFTCFDCRLIWRHGSSYLTSDVWPAGSLDRMSGFIVGANDMSGDRNEPLPCHSPHMCHHMWTAMCQHTCVYTHVSTPMCMRACVCTNVYARMCIDVGIGMGIDVSISCITDMHVYRHEFRHAHSNLYRPCHVDVALEMSSFKTSAACGLMHASTHACTHASTHACTPACTPARMLRLASYDD